MDSWALTQVFLDPGDIGSTADQVLWLSAVQQTNTVDGQVATPPVSLNVADEALLCAVLAQQPGPQLMVEVPAFMAGDAAHVGIGTDFDGGFGLQSSPKELDSIADLPKLLPFLSAKGYAQSQLEAIAHGNFLRVLQSALPH